MTFSLNQFCNHLPRALNKVVEGLITFWRRSYCLLFLLRVRQEDCYHLHVSRALPQDWKEEETRLTKSFSKSVLYYILFF